MAHAVRVLLAHVKKIVVFTAWAGVPYLFAVRYLSAQQPLDRLTAALIGITGYYAWLTQAQLERTKDSARVAIRPFITATRLSKELEVGAFAGEEGLNKVIHIMNVGSGHAHRVNVRISPPAEAYTKEPDGTIRKEGPIHVIHQVEFPVGAKRMWNASGAFCGITSWHYLYAEYEDMEGNAYYSLQSGYSVRTGRIQDLRQKRRKGDTNPLWERGALDGWLEHIDTSLKIWAEEQRKIYAERAQK